MTKQLILGFVLFFGIANTVSAEKYKFSFTVAELPTVVIKQNKRAIAHIKCPEEESAYKPTVFAIPEEIKVYNAYIGDTKLETHDEWADYSCEFRAMAYFDEYVCIGNSEYGTLQILPLSIRLSDAKINKKSCGNLEPSPSRHYIYPVQKPASRTIRFDKLINDLKEFELMYGTGKRATPAN